MPSKIFIIKLLVYATIALVVHFSLIYLLELNQYSTFSLISIVFFIVLSIMFYIWGDIASRSRNIYLFSNIIIITLITKMILSAVLVMGYYYKEQPPTNFFILPFFAHYTIFTLFILDFMTKQAKHKIDQTN